MAIQSSIKFERESRDFAVIVDDQIVGWRGSHAEAEALRDATVTRRLQQRAAADAAQPMTPPERTEDEWAAALDAFDATAEARADALEFEPFEDCEIETCCESCGEPLDIDAAILGNGLMLCDHCYDLGDGQAERQAYREALAVQGAIEDARVEAEAEYRWLTQGQGNSRLTA